MKETVSDDSDAPAPARGSFPTTQWSVVFNAGAASESQARAALETLCRQYWRPLYSYTRRQGRSHHEAEDCTQAFLARLLAADGVSRAQRERGRFRSFLLTALKNFLASEWRRSQAEKRGGSQATASLEALAAEEQVAPPSIDPTLTPDQVFDRSWAQEMIERALRELRQDYEQSGRGTLFAALAPLVWGEEETKLAEPAARLGMTAHALTVARHRLRQRLGQRLRAAVAETVASEAEVDDELRHLIASLSTGGR